MKDRQKKLREGCVAASLDLDQVIQTAATWDLQTAGREERTLHAILFDPPPIGAKFKLPK